MFSHKPSKVRKKIFNAPLNRLSKLLNSPLSEELRKKYGKRSTRVRKGDSVRIVRGEFTGVEGKVTSVNLKHGSIVVEGVFRESVKGEQAPVRIHASKVIINSLNLDDKRRKAHLEAITSQIGGAQ
jgi:large subunit ribosomal protein L24